jgi:hypothetical protein
MSNSCLINEIVSKCDNRRKIFLQQYNGKNSCGNCPYEILNGKCCHNYASHEFDCSSCLGDVFYPNDTDKSLLADYGCPHMLDYYVCRYAYEFTSELLHACYYKLCDFYNRDVLKVLSLGCGPCTDLFAIDYICGFLKYKGKHVPKIEYYGIDQNAKFWETIHDDIREYRKMGGSISVFKIFQGDILGLFTKKNLSKLKITPDIIFCQYLFSDMQRQSKAMTSVSLELGTFVEELAAYFQEKMNPDSYLVINDVDATVMYKGCLDYLFKLESLLRSASIVSKGYFQSGNSKYHYGEEFKANKLCFNSRYNNLILETYDRNSKCRFCSSAQLVLKN